MYVEKKKAVYCVWLCIRPGAQAMREFVMGGWWRLEGGEMVRVYACGQQRGESVVRARVSGVEQ